MVLVEGEGSPTERTSPVVIAAERLVVRISTLVDEVARLRAENQQLRAEVREAVALFDGAANAAANGDGPARRRATLVAKPKAPARRRRRGRSPKGRATPTDVTADVVRAVLVKLGEGTASEIAAEITRARVQAGVGGATAPVGGRAVRFLAERAGATTRVGEDGQRRYRLG
jgi:hypothetical protein